MVYEHQIKRTIYVAKCNCDPNEPFQDIRSSNPPRETMCPKCRTWVSFHEETATSPEYKGDRKLILE